MKPYIRIMIALGLTGVILASCDNNKSEDPSPIEVQLSNLSGTWKASSVTVDGTDVKSDYAAFELTLSGSANADVFAYGVTGRPKLSPWPAGGTWKFGADLNSDLVRDPGTADELSMDYSITGSQLTIKFIFTGIGYNSRVSTSEGNWVYTFTKK